MLILKMEIALKSLANIQIFKHHKLAFHKSYRILYFFIENIQNHVPPLKKFSIDSIKCDLPFLAKMLEIKINSSLILLLEAFNPSPLTAALKMSIFLFP